MKKHKKKKVSRSKVSRKPRAEVVATWLDKDDGSNKAGELAVEVTGRKIQFTEAVVKGFRSFLNEKIKYLERSVSNTSENKHLRESNKIKINSLKKKIKETERWKKFPKSRISKSPLLFSEAFSGEWWGDYVKKVNNQRVTKKRKINTKLAKRYESERVKKENRRDGISGVVAVDEMIDEVNAVLNRNCGGKSDTSTEAEGSGKYVFDNKADILSFLREVFELVIIEYDEGRRQFFRERNEKEETWEERIGMILDVVFTDQRSNR